MSTRKSTSTAEKVTNTETKSTTTATATTGPGTLTTTATTTATKAVTSVTEAKGENAKKTNTVASAETTTATSARKKSTEVDSVKSPTEMGTNASTTTAGESIESNAATSALKETTTNTTKTETKRITRNSPLPLQLITSPNPSQPERRGTINSTAESEPTNSESEESSISATGAATKRTQIRGRKSVNDIKDSKESKEDQSDRTDRDKKEKEESTEIKEVKELKANKEKNNKEEGEKITTVSKTITKTVNLNLESKDSKNIEVSDNSKDHKNSNVPEVADETKVSKEVKDNREFKDAKDSKEPKDAAESKDSKDSIDKDSKDTKVLKETRDCENSLDTKDSTDLKPSKESKDSKNFKDSKEPKDSQESKISKESKDIKDTKGSKTGSNTHATPSSSNTSSSSSTNITSRVTRKAAAQDYFANTRITRNRQTNASRSATPPTTAGRSARRCAKKMPVPMVSEAPSASTKRKRSEEDGTASAGNVEPGAKYIKIEVKDDASSDITESDDHSAINDSEGLKIKQELIDSDDSENAPLISVVTTSTSASTSTRNRGSRWASRKPALPLQNSPSTRATRQTKGSSPLPSAIGIEPKRRRVTSASGSALTRSSSSTSLPKSNTTAGHDEDSKDSMASSMDDLILADIKVEKLTPELDDEDFVMETEKSELLNKPSQIEIKIEDNPDVKPPVEVDEKQPETEIVAAFANGVGTNVEPLIVDTEEVSTKPSQDGDDAKKSETEIIPSATVATDIVTSAAKSDKAASLSPEMISEGVCEISVKKFYKKPEFLANNLGIEEDPKLGEIVQKVNTEKAAVLEEAKASINLHKIPVITIGDADDSVELTVKHKAQADDVLNVSLESLKEGELLLEDSNDDKPTQPIDDIEVGSPSTENLSPLLVEDDEDENVNQVKNSERLQSEQEQEDTIVDRELVNDDDDATAEESETISMDNNPSTDDVQEREEMEIVDDLEDDNEIEEKVIETEDKIDEIIANPVDGDIKKLEIPKKDEKEVTKDIVESISTELIDLKSENKIPDQESIDDKMDIDIKDNDVDAALLPISTVSKSLELENLTEISSVEKVSKLDVESEAVIAKIDAVIAKLDADAELKATCEKVKEVKANVEVVIDAKEVQNKAKIEKNEDIAPVKVMQTEVLEEKKIKIDEGKTKGDKVPIIAAEIIVSKPLHEIVKLITPTSSVAGSPAKPQNSIGGSSFKEDDTTSNKSGISTDTNSWVTLDTEYDEETLRQKEQHLQNLGLLTHKAAEKRRQEFIQNSEASRTSHGSTKRNGKSTASGGAASQEYTGTLKTVIKLNRNSTGSSAIGGAGSAGSAISGNGGRKSTGSNSTAAAKDGQRRQSLKMTFQKGRGRGQGNATDRSTDNQAHTDDSYYTIQNENEGAPKKTAALEQSHSITHGRKSYNRSYNNSSATTTTNNSAKIESSHSDGHGHDPNNANKKEEKEEILIPEKASSFKFHPGRLCQDQCFYCSGKFGLYDTPCHVGQIKSLERQQKILANEEKLTVDNCLCDACFRHVDRRANVPSYKKRVTGPLHLEPLTSATYTSGVPAPTESGFSLSIDADHTAINTSPHQHAEDETHARKCVVPECLNPAAHSLRRKCIRKSVKKFLLNFDMPTGGSYVSLCQAHYDAVIQCSGCVLCKRRLGKNHMYHITSDTDRLEKALSELGIPVQLGIGTAVCKLCRYFANLLMKPPDKSKSQKAEFVKNYRKRLLQFHNILDGSNDASEDENNTNTTAAEEVAKLKTPEKTASILKASSSESNATTPAKNLLSPAGSSGSSVELVIDDAEVNPIAATANVPSRSNESNNDSQIALGSDTLVDYDVPMVSSESSSSSPSPPTTSTNQMSKLKAILQNTSSSYERADISNVLRSNPNISMRELFPGEEDLGLQFKAPFGSSTSQRTPEGWTRVQTFLQYDEPTRHLWEDLQKPYGNQSSFLRHLILLEKYFRNGDLVLTPNASSNASVYSRTVRQRLNSYDKGHCGGLDTAKPSTSAAAAAKSTSAAKEKSPKEKAPKEKNANEKDDEVIALESNDEDENNAEESLLSKQLRQRSASVDKLTKQLNTNAVTIIARPKDLTAASPQKSLVHGANSQQNTQPSQVKEKEPPAITTITPGAPNLAAAAAAAAAALASTSTTSNISSATNASNSRSILKSNLLGINKSAVEILPINKSSNLSANSTTTLPPPTVTTITESKQQKILDVANKLLGNQLEAAAANAANSSSSSSGAAINSKQTAAAASLLTSPPELVSLQRRASLTGSNSATVPSTTTATNLSLPPAPISIAPSSTTASLINAKRPHLMAKTNAGRGSAAPPNVVILPETLTPQERLQSKSWRPTLMPVEENQHLVNKGGPLYQTADGRRLPALVQVQSGGKPFLISIFDYNRMCILRREKLLRDQMLKASKSRREMQQQQQHQQQQQQQRHSNAAATVAAAQASLQNAFGNNSSNSSNNNNQSNKQQQAAQQQLLHLQLMQLQKHQQKQQQQAALKNISRFQTIAPKPNSSSSATATTSSQSMALTGGVNNMQPPPPNFNAPMMPMLANAITNAAAAAAVGGLSNNSAANASWLWNNFPDANQLLLNGAPSASNSASKHLPQLLAKPVTSGSFTGVTGSASFNAAGMIKQQQQLLFDNALMSKIPKSLTVIPQHKVMMGSNVNNNPGLGGSGSGMNKD